MDDDPILLAARLCREAHSGQKRRYIGLPYHVHPARVAGRVALLGGATVEMVCAAYLHDVLEDTAFPETAIAARFGPTVHRLVRELTNPSKGMDAPRGVRKALDRRHLQAVSSEAKRIKMLDRIDNLSDLRGVKTDFRAIYAGESRLMAEVVGDADADLKAELLALCAEIEAAAVADTPSE